ncbi:MAG TPA: GNAT family N-acetyltransferase [Candidatus Angelobacter sp.]|nr:GNAT family N-acetyltransferase [Candidatus Angelobacter sp.]
MPHPAKLDLKVMKSIEDYPPGLIGTITALFGRCIAATHGVEWTLDVMIAEAQCEFFRRFDSARDRVWVATENGILRGAITIDGPRPEAGRESARLRFFILDEAVRGLGFGRRMVGEAMQFCLEQGYDRVHLTTLPGLDAALRLYYEQGFVLVSQSEKAFHGSAHVEQVLEWKRA